MLDGEDDADRVPVVAQVTQEVEVRIAQRGRHLSLLHCRHSTTGPPREAERTCVSLLRGVPLAVSF